MFDQRIEQPHSRDTVVCLEVILTKSVFRLIIWDDQPLKPNTSLARLIAAIGTRCCIVMQRMVVTMSS